MNVAVRAMPGSGRLVLAILAGMAAAVPALAATDVRLDPFDPDLTDKPSLQRGMALFANYCLGCHSLKFQRYERTADDLGIPHDVALRNLIFTGQAIGGLMETSMPAEGAKNWFGVPPPDLTMVDRVRGTAWVYNMLKGFYVDEKRPFGVNNRVFENIAMPHVLIGLQGVPEVECRGKKAANILLIEAASWRRTRPPAACARTIALDARGARHRRVLRRRVRSGGQGHRQFSALRRRPGAPGTPPHRLLGAGFSGRALCAGDLAEPRVLERCALK